MLWSVCIYYECKSHAKRVWDLDSMFLSKQYSIFLYYTKSVPRTTAPKHIPAIPPIHQPTTLGTATSDTTFASRARVAVHLFEPFLKTFDRFCKNKFDGLMLYFSCKKNRICINYVRCSSRRAGTYGEWMWSSSSKVLADMVTLFKSEEGEGGGGLRPLHRLVPSKYQKGSPSKDASAPGREVHAMNKNENHRERSE